MPLLASSIQQTRLIGRGLSSPRALGGGASLWPPLLIRGKQCESGQCHFSSRTLRFENVTFGRKLETVGSCTLDKLRARDDSEGAALDSKTHLSASGRPSRRELDRSVNKKNRHGTTRAVRGGQHAKRVVSFSSSTRRAIRGVERGVEKRKSGLEARVATGEKARGHGHSASVKIHDYL